MKSSIRILSVLSVLIVACGSGSNHDAKQGAMCGGIEGIQCEKALFCKYPTGSCGTGDQSGTCEIKPEMCMAMYAPVCGCDGKTYGNECEANGAGQSIKAMGECTK